MTGAVSNISCPTNPLAVATDLGIVALAAAAPLINGEPALINETGKEALTALSCAGFRSAEDLALEIELLQAQSSTARAAQEKQQARSNKKERLQTLQKRMEELAKAAEEKAKAEKSSFWSKFFKWVAAIVAAVAGALSSAFSGGAGAAVAAVVIAVIMSAESVVKAVTDALVECGKMSEKAASVLRACLGCIEDILTQLADVGAFGEKGEKVAAVLSLIVGAAKAIVSCVVGGVSGVADIISAVCSLTAEAVTIAQQTIAMVSEALHKEDELSPEMMLVLSIISACCDLVALGCSFADSGSGEVQTPNQDHINTIVKGVCGSTEAAAGLGAAGFELSAALHRADADESDAEAAQSKMMMEVAAEQLKQAVARFKEIFEELNSVRDDVASMLEIEQETFNTIFTPTRA